MKKILLTIVFLLIQPSMKSNAQKPVAQPIQGLINLERVKCYLDKMLPYALYCENTYQIPAEVYLSICCYESGYGTSNKAKLKNNHLGLKNCKFRSLQTATDFFGKLLTKNPVYSGLKGCQEYREYCFVLSWSGYNKEKDYAPHLIGVIENLGLRQYIENSKSVACN